MVCVKMQPSQQSNKCCYGEGPPFLEHPTTHAERRQALHYALGHGLLTQSQQSLPSKGGTAAEQVEAVEAASNTTSLDIHRAAMTTSSRIEAWAVCLDSSRIHPLDTPRLETTELIRFQSENIFGFIGHQWSRATHSCPPELSLVTSSELLTG